MKLNTSTEALAYLIGAEVLKRSKSGEYTSDSHLKSKVDSQYKVFPEYFGFNLDSFDEMLNDLSWLDTKKIAIFIRNSEQFISKERNPDKLPTLLDLLDATCEDWKWVDESEDFEPKELTIVFTPSERIQTLLEQQEIYFEKID